MTSADLRRIARLSVLAQLLPALFPTVATAAWGDENWGEMVWGGATISIPALPTAGIVLLGVLLIGIAYRLLATRRTNESRPSQPTR